MKLRQIFSDMDGTLLNSSGIVSDGNAKIIRGAKIPFTLVSARAPMEMRAAIDKLELTGPQIGFNGGLIFEKGNDGWKVIDENALDFDTARFLLQFLRKEFPEVSQSYYDLNNWYSERRDAGIELEENLTGQQITLTPLSEKLSQSIKIYKIMIIVFSPEKMEELKSSLLSLGNDKVSIQQSGENYLEITSILAKKSRGISYIMGQEKLVKEDCAAFGDGHNDLPMFEMVELPIAMENAAEEVKNKARYITKSNDEDGVACGIQKYLLKVKH